MLFASFSCFPSPILIGTVKPKHFVNKVLSENLFYFSERYGNVNKILHQGTKKKCLHLIVCEHIAAVKYFLLPKKEYISTQPDIRSQHLNMCLENTKKMVQELLQKSSFASELLYLL